MLSLYSRVYPSRQVQSPQRAFTPLFLDSHISLILSIAGVVSCIMPLSPCVSTCIILIRIQTELISHFLLYGRNAAHSPTGSLPVGPAVRNAMRSFDSPMVSRAGLASSSPPPPASQRPRPVSPTLVSSEEGPSREVGSTAQSQFNRNEGRSWSYLHRLKRFSPHRSIFPSSHFPLPSLLFTFRFSVSDAGTEKSPLLVRGRGLCLL